MCVPQRSVLCHYRTYTVYSSTADSEQIDEQMWFVGLIHFSATIVSTFECSLQYVIPHDESHNVVKAMTVWAPLTNELHWHMNMMDDGMFVIP